MQANWLHISDLHFGEENVDRTQFEKHIEKYKPNFIVITGDLHEYGKPYKKTKQFLDYLIEACDLTKNDIFMVPGNHDVDCYNLRDPDQKKKHMRMLAWLNKHRKEYDGKKSDFYYKRSPLSQRFFTYSRFVSQYFGVRHEASKDSAGVFIRSWNGQISLLHINTALYSTKNNFNENAFFDALALAEARLSEEQKKLPTLLLAHHGFNRLGTEQRKNIESIVDRLNVVAYLCGDEHVSDECYIRASESGRLVPCIVTSKGTISSERWSESGFVFYTWDGNLSHSASAERTIWIRHHNIPHVETLGKISMNPQGAAELSRELRDRIEQLDSTILPGIRDEENERTYLNGVNGNSFPLVELLHEKILAGYQYFYLFEGQRSTRGGTGKTSSLLSFYKANDSNFVPIYIPLQENRSNLAQKMEQEIENAERLSHGKPILLLLDGFDEIPSISLRQTCIQEILRLRERHPHPSAIVISGRDPMDIYLQAVSNVRNEGGINLGDIERYTSQFLKCKVLELTEEQQREYLGNSAPSGASGIWSILSTPFFASRYRESNQPLLGETAERWKTEAFINWLNNNHGPVKISLMLGSLLYEVNRLREASVSDVERRRFILTKVLPAIAYRLVLESRVVAQFRGENRNTAELRRSYVEKLTAATLNVYTAEPTIGIWPEYSKGRYQDIFEDAWSSYWTPDSGWKGVSLAESDFLIGPLTANESGEYEFTHGIYLEFFASFHIANVVYALSNGAMLPAGSPASFDAFFVELENIDHQTLLQAEEILEIYYGLPFKSQDVKMCKKCMKRFTDYSVERMILSQIFIRFIEADISEHRQSPTQVINEQRQYCHTLFEYFYHHFPRAVKYTDGFINRYKSFYLYATCLLARDFRTGQGCEKDLDKCSSLCDEAIKNQKKYEIPKVDGYLQKGLLLNAALEASINRASPSAEVKADTQMADAVYEQVRSLCSEEDNEAALTKLRDAYYIPLTAVTTDEAKSFEEILRHAKLSYEAASARQKRISALSYTSKAYFVLAALGTSGGAFNMLGMMFANQADAMEQLSASAAMGKKQKIDVNAALYHDNFLHSYRMFKAVSEIQRGDQPYSNMKIAELILKGHIKFENGSPCSGSGERLESTSLETIAVLSSAIYKAESGKAALSSYWHGRLLLVEANMAEDSSLRQRYIKQACAFFRKEERRGKSTEVTYADYIDGDAIITIPTMLAAIELLAPELRKADSSRCNSFNDMCVAVFRALKRQAESLYLNSQHPMPSNEKYCVSTSDALENLERFRKNAADLMNGEMCAEVEALKGKVEQLRRDYW